MKRFLRFTAAALAASLLSLVPAGCGGDDDDGGGGGDIAEGNNRDLVACVGDSITQGYACDGAPYPSRLATMSGKTVLNYGVGGTTSSYGVSVIGSVLGRKPGYVCILFGANDAIHEEAQEKTVGNLRRIVQTCKANGSRPLLATPTPMKDGHVLFSGRVNRLAEAIRTMAKEEGVSCVDLNKAFGDGGGLLNADGLHMTDAGSDLIAKKFNSRM